MPHSLGIEALSKREVDGVEKEVLTFCRLVPIDALIPARGSKTFVTTKNNQTGVKIQVFEGEEVDCKRNKELGVFQVGGLPPMAAGEVEVEVVFEVNENCMCDVTATTSFGQSGTVRDLKGESLAKKVAMSRQHEAEVRAQQAEDARKA